MLRHGQRYDKLRVYFNHKNDYPNVWSVDDGDQANEKIFRKVTMAAYATTKYNGEVPTENSPVAWLEVHNVTANLYPDGEVILSGVSD